jgi:hypothetical protein
MAKRAVQQVLEERTAQDLHSNTHQDFLILQQKALKFLTNIQNYSTLFETSKKRIAMQSIKKNLSTFYGLMKQDTELTQKIIMEAHEFEGAVNKFLNRTMYLSYVNDDGGILFLDEAHTGELYKTATANAGRGNISKTKITDINDLSEELNKKIQKSVLRNRPVYMSALQRWNKPNFGYQKHFYYKVDGNWKPSRRVRTKGRIAEAYVQLVVDDEKSKTIEYGLQLLDNRIEIDNIPAVVKGDVVYDMSGNVHFAVKEGSFSTAKIGSYYFLALNIVDIKNPPTVEQFQQALPKLVRISAIADKIIDEMNKEAEESVDEVVTSIK